MLETRNTSTGTRRAETIVIHRQRDIMRLVNPLLSFSRTDRSQSTKSQENIKLPIRHMANTDQPMAKWAVSGIFSYLETLLINSEVLKFLQLWFRFLTFRHCLRYALLYRLFLFWEDFDLAGRYWISFQICYRHRCLVDYYQKFTNTRISGKTLTYILSKYSIIKISNGLS